MKRLKIRYCIIILTFFALHASTADDIRGQVERIKSRLSANKTMEIDSGEKGDEAIPLKIYFKDKQINKIELSAYGTQGNSVYDYYYLNGKVIYIEVKISTYNAPSYAEGEYDPEKTEVTYNKFYFSDNKLINKSINNDSSTLTDEKKLLENSAEYLNKAKEALK